MQQMPLRVLFSAVPSPFPIIAPLMFHPFPSQSSFLLPLKFNKEVCGSFTCPAKNDSQFWSWRGRIPRVPWGGGPTASLAILVNIGNEQ